MTICSQFSSVGCFSFVSNEVVEMRGNSCVGFFGRFGQDVFFSLACDMMIRVWGGLKFG